MLGYEIEHLWVHVEHPAADQIAASWYRKQTAPSFDLLPDKDRHRSFIAWTLVKGWNVVER
jgi:hypothetical protein